MWAWLVHWHMQTSKIFIMVEKNDCCNKYNWKKDGGKNDGEKNDGWMNDGWNMMAK